MAVGRGAVLPVDDEALKALLGCEDAVSQLDPEDKGAVENAPAKENSEFKHVREHLKKYGAKISARKNYPSRT